jgi:hypothetical protein
VRALLFGAGAAVAGLILYSIFGIVTGLVIGYLSLGVGYLVGKAMMMGSRGVGGRRYQIAAVLYTYMAVSMSAIPIGAAYGIKYRRAYEAQWASPVQGGTSGQTRSTAESNQRLQQEFGNSAARPLPPPRGAKSAGGTQGMAAPAGVSSEGETRKATQAEPSSGVRRSPHFAAALGYLALLGLASPFLELQTRFKGPSVSSFCWLGFGLHGT